MIVIQGSKEIRFAIRSSHVKFGHIGQCYCHPSVIIIHIATATASSNTTTTITAAPAAAPYYYQQLLLFLHYRMFTRPLLFGKRQALYVYSDKM